MKAAPKILIIRLSSLGDILHALPAFADLRASLPNAKIDWLVGKKASFLLSAIPGIDEIHVLDAHFSPSLPGKVSQSRRPWSLIRELRIRHYDYSIDFQGLLKTALLSFLSGARSRVGFSKALVREPPAHWFYDVKLQEPKKPGHVLQLNRMLAQLVGACRTASLPDFLVSPEDSNYVDSLLKKERLRDFVVINPGAGWPTKRWKPERYGVLAARIEKGLGMPVVVITGPGEEVYYEEIAKYSSASRHFVLSFLQLIPLLKKTHLFIGGDTGPFHLACALGTATVGIFGPTSPVRNGPWSNKDEVVVHNLKCSFCYGRTCPTKNECMDISVDEVFNAVVKRLQNRKGAE